MTYEVLLSQPLPSPPLATPASPGNGVAQQPLSGGRRPQHVDAPHLLSQKDATKTKEADGERKKKKKKTAQRPQPVRQDEYTYVDTPR